MPSVYEVIANRIISQLESGVAPWHKPWKARGKYGLPRNLVTQREYRGINVWILLSNGYSSPYWLTFRQARELDGHVRQGEVGFPVVYWKFGTREVQDGDEVIEKASVLCRYYTVFNVEQCEGLRLQPTRAADEEPEVRPIEQCERIVNHWQEKPPIKHGGDYASYNKTIDLVRMPESSCFNSAEEYYSTLFHELTHNAAPRIMPRWMWKACRTEAYPTRLVGIITAIPGMRVVHRRADTVRVSNPEQRLVLVLSL